MRTNFNFGTLLLFVTVCWGPAVAAERKLGGCPDLRGIWTCEIYTNRSEDREPIFETIRNTQETLPNARVAYNIGGAKFESVWDEESIVPYNKKDPEAVEVKVRCLDERTLLFWFERAGVPYQQTIRRESPERIVSDTIRLHPEFGSNNVVTRICQPAKWP